MTHSVELNKDLLNQKKNFLLNSLRLLFQIANYRQVFQVTACIEPKIENVIFIEAESLYVSKRLANTDGFSDDSVELDFNLVKNEFSIFETLILDIDQVSEGFLANDMVPFDFFLLNELMYRIDQHTEIVSGFQHDLKDGFDYSSEIT